MLNQQTRNTEFPSLRDMTYLNTAAEGIPPRAVGEAINRYYQDKLKGMAGRDAHFATRDSALKLVGQMYGGLSVDEVNICSCSSEAYNLAAMALRLTEGDEVVINDLDFPAGATPWLQDTCPAKTKVWRARGGALRIEDLPALLSPKTRMLTVSQVSFFNGFTINLPSVAEVVRRHSPALVGVDVTQALGRIPLDLRDADLIVSSTHKWILASHGGGLVGIPKRAADRLTVPAGGWFNLQNAFDADRFERAVSKPGAASFAVGMPNFPAIYPIEAALKYIQSIGVDAIDRHARPLVNHCLDELLKLPGIEVITPNERDALAGILAFKHPQMEKIHARLLDNNVHVMSQAGRMRISIHGYNTADDVEKLLATLKEASNHV
jgi:selenocysteine lyase/cysteine desulfurase